MVAVCLLFSPRSLPAQALSRADATTPAGSLSVAFAAGSKVPGKLRQAIVRGIVVERLGVPQARITLSSAMRSGNTTIPAGTYDLSIRRDQLGTWLQLDGTSHPSRRLNLVLEVAASDSISPGLTMKLLPDSSAKVVLHFQYDSAHRKEIDRYRIGTDSAEDGILLSIDWEANHWLLLFVRPTGDPPRGDSLDI